MDIEADNLANKSKTDSTVRRIIKERWNEPKRLGERIDVDNAPKFLTFCCLCRGSEMHVFDFVKIYIPFF